MDTLASMNVPIKTHTAKEKYIIGMLAWKPRYKSLNNIAAKGTR